MDEIKDQICLITRLVDGGDAVEATKAAQRLVALLEAEQLKSKHPLVKWDSKANGAPTAEDVRALLDYDPETGNFYWKRRTTPRRMAGATAGTTSKEGYVSISIGYKAYKAHRLAWLHVNGVWPNGVIDHINGDPGDNRIANLRETSQLRNSQNRTRPNSGSKSGTLGVRPEGAFWRAQITSGGKTFSLGVFATKAAAEEAYLQAKSRIHSGAVVFGC